MVGIETYMIHRCMLTYSTTKLILIQISVLVPEILKFEKWVNYANEMIDDVIRSTKYCIKYINSAIFVNLQQNPLKRGGLIVLSATHLQQ